jgi:hypothetical protein
VPAVERWTSEVAGEEISSVTRVPQAAARRHSDVTTSSARLVIRWLPLALM